MRRVMIVGGSGAGKSTLARALGARTGLPVIHIDHIHWMPGWVERSAAEKALLCHEVHMRDAWIFEGGHSASWPERMARADTLIWLDLPVWRRQWRVIRRAIHYRGQTRPDLPEGCAERLGVETLAFHRFIWTSRRAARARLLGIFADPPAGLRTLRLSGARAVAGFLAGIDARAAPGADSPREARGA